MAEIRKWRFGRGQISACGGMVDPPVLGTGAREGRVGSSPTRPTIHTFGFCMFIYAESPWNLFRFRGFFVYLQKVCYDKG